MESGFAMWFWNTNVCRNLKQSGIYNGSWGSGLGRGEGVAEHACCPGIQQCGNKSWVRGEDGMCKEGGSLNPLLHELFNRYWNSDSGSRNVVFSMVCIWIGKIFWTHFLLRQTPQNRNWGCSAYDLIAIIIPHYGLYSKLSIETKRISGTPSI